MKPKLKTIVQYIRDAAKKKIGIIVAMANPDSPTGYSYGYAIYRPKDVYDIKEGYSIALRRCVNGEESPKIKGDRSIFIFDALTQLAIRAHRYFKTDALQTMEDEYYPTVTIGEITSATELVNSQIILISEDNGLSAPAVFHSFNPIEGIITYKVG